MKKLLMVSVLGMALAFCMSGCSSCPSWCPFYSADKAVCACCDKGAACKCATDGKAICDCCKCVECKCIPCKAATVAKDVTAK